MKPNELDLAESFLIRDQHGRTRGLVAYPRTKPRLYAVVHPCVVLADCPDCGALAGKLCRRDGAVVRRHHSLRVWQSKDLLGSAEPLPAAVIRVGEASIVDLRFFEEGMDLDDLDREGPEDDSE